jgi:deoxyribodipyrimidine photolyase-related protein
MPNTRGMSQFADGGIVGTKPYVSTGQYLKKQSHYCGSCHYRVEERVGEKACPLNALYWEFHHRHRPTLGSLPRLGYTYPTWDKMDPEQQNALLAQAAHWHQNRDTL